MSQHDFDIINQGFPAFRSDMNLAFVAGVSLSSGGTEPSTKFAYQWWADTTTNLLKQRNAANNAWLVRAPLNALRFDDFPRSYLAGLGLANNGSDATNDIDIAVGECRDDANGANLILASPLIKRIDTSWVVGTNQGGMDTGSVADDNWYHVWLIRRSDTGVVDVLFSLSVTSPTMPSNYDEKRRIGSVRRGTATNLGFNQYGNYFAWDDPPLSWDVTDQSTTQIGRTLLTPPGIRLDAIINALVSHATTGVQVYLRDPNTNDEAPSNAVAPLATIVAEVGGALQNQGPMRVRTNAGSEINSRSTQSSTTLKIVTLGWIDHRGRDD